VSARLGVSGSGDISIVGRYLEGMNSVHGFNIWYLNWMNTTTVCIRYRSGMWNAAGGWEMQPNDIHLAGLDAIIGGR